MDDFIGVYDNALTPEQCAHIIERFNASKQVTRGKTGQGVDVKKKDSYDITISQHAEWNDVSNLMMGAVLRNLVNYVKQYRMLVMGALSPTLVHPKTGEPTVLSLDNFDDFDDTLIKDVVMAMYRGGAINLQKYLQNSGGYHHWHSEVYPQNQTCETLHRVLLFQFYLNDVAEGGSTEFYYQKRHIDARQGRLIIAPAGFTHSHKGHVAKSGDKYVATSWILFQRAETLYGK
jgi:hypothetical protein